MSICKHPQCGGHHCNSAAGFRQWPRDPLIRHGTQMIRSFAQFRMPLHVMAASLALMLACMGVANAQQAPIPEVDTARQAVDRADQADADQYAPEPMARARNLLAQAQQAQSNRDKKDAIEFALRASADADLARALSQEALANSELQHRRAEISDLQRKLGTEDRQ